MSLSLDRINISHKGEDDIQSIDNNFQDIQSEVNSHLAESANKHIHSEGTGWIRFDNGWQICEGVLNFGNLPSDTLETLEFEYPKEFISAPKIFLTMRHTTVTLNTIKNYQTTINGTPATDKVSVSLAHLGFSVHTSTVRVNVLAIGKWK